MAHLIGRRRLITRTFPDDVAPVPFVGANLRSAQSDLRSLRNTGYAQSLDEAVDKARIVAEEKLLPRVFGAVVRLALQQFDRRGFRMRSVERSRKCRKSARRIENDQCDQRAQKHNSNHLPVLAD